MERRRYLIFVGEREYPVDLVPTEGGGFDEPVRVRVGERELLVTVGTDGMASVREEGSTHQARVWLPSGRRPQVAWCDGAVRSLVVRSPQEAAYDAVAAAAAGSEGHAVVESPMPGRIVRVLVSEGDDVEVSQPLLIVEAMKMENEVRAPTSGRVQKLGVKAGDTVESAALLCEIVAHDAST